MKFFKNEAFFLEIGVPGKTKNYLYFYADHGHMPSEPL